MPKILHIADVHLDTPFSLLDSEKAAARRSELRGIFSSAMMYIESANIDVVLIAGDLFDTGFAGTKTLSLLKKTFESYPRCKFVIAPGNHDPYNDTSFYKTADFPENVYIFSQENVQKFSFDDLNMDVYGYAFCQNEMRHSPLAAFSVEDPERINILLAHCDISSPLSPYAPVTKADIAASGVDYAALGHIHNTDGVQTAGNVHYAYSGCLDGRSFDELGHKGGIVVNIEKKNGRTELFETKGLRFSKRHYEKDTLDISASIDTASVEQKIRAHIAHKKYDGDTLLRLELVGSVSASLELRPSLLEKCDFGLFFIEIENKTLPLYDSEKLKSDPTIRGEFFRTVLPYLENGSPSERQIYREALRLGLLALAGEDLGEI